MSFFGNTKKYKNAIKVKVKKITCTFIRSKYVCPRCNTHVETGIDENVTRFLCGHCKNELIVERED